MTLWPGPRGWRHSGRGSPARRMAPASRRRGCCGSCRICLSSPLLPSPAAWPPLWSSRGGGGGGRPPRKRSCQDAWRDGERLIVLRSVPSWRESYFCSHGVFDAWESGTWAWQECNRHNWVQTWAGIRKRGSGPRTGVEQITFEHFRGGRRKTTRGQEWGEQGKSTAI